MQFFSFLNKKGRKIVSHKTVILTVMREDQMRFELLTFHAKYCDIMQLLLQTKQNINL